MKQIIAYKDYFKDFYDALTQKEKDKVDRVLVLMQSDNRMPAHYISPLEQGIYELRITLPDKESRLLFFYDGPIIVVLLNCFIKKTRKTPRKEIEQAIKLKKSYYEEMQ